jgi:hypothetical protein
VAHPVGLPRHQRFMYVGAPYQCAFQIVLPLLDEHLRKIQVNHHALLTWCGPTFPLPHRLTVML